MFLGLTEIMRSLGYHQQIPMESFHNPNFALVSEILLWLALRFEPDTNLPNEIETSEQRVYFIRSIVEFFVCYLLQVYLRCIIQTSEIHFIILYTGS